MLAPEYFCIPHAGTPVWVTDPSALRMRMNPPDGLASINASRRPSGDQVGADPVANHLPTPVSGSIDRTWNDRSTVRWKAITPSDTAAAALLTGTSSHARVRAATAATL